MGDGPCRQRLQALAADLDLANRVDFRGHRSHADTLDEIRRSRAVCVPSLWEEPFGMIAAEAQMHGVAVVASRTGGLPEIVEDGATGHLHPPGDVAAIAGRLDDVCSDAARAIDMGSRGHERARGLFSIDGFTDRFEALYDEMMHAREARP